MNIYTVKNRKPKRNYKGTALDNCQTPGYALEPLIPYLSDKFNFVWECASGDGYLWREIKKYVFSTIHTDIKSGYDFFDWQPDFWDCIITNPPYGLKYDWIEHCYQLNKPWALLMPIETIGAAKAQTLFKTYGISIIFMSKRVNFKMPTKGWKGSAQFPVAWFTWKFGLENGKHEFFDASHWTQQYREQFECEITDL